jgi:hypothetical protein
VGDKGVVFGAAAGRRHGAAMLQILKDFHFGDILAGRMIVASTDI